MLEPLRVVNTVASWLNAYKRFRNQRLLSTTKIDLNQILIITKICIFIGKTLSQKNQFEWRICLWNIKILHLKKRHLVRKFCITERKIFNQSISLFTFIKKMEKLQNEKWAFNQKRYPHYLMNFLKSLFYYFSFLNILKSMYWKLRYIPL